MRWRSLIDSAVVRVLVWSPVLLLGIPYVLKWTCLTTSLSDGVLIGTGVAVIWYTIETYYLRREMAEQNKIGIEQNKIARDQTDVLRAATEYDLLLRLDGVFNSERLQRDRRNAARALKVRIPVRPAEGQELWTNMTDAKQVQKVLDVFELLGLLVKRHALDEMAVWSLFSYYVINYYLYCEKTKYLEEWLDDPTFYEEFKTLYQQMQAISLQKTGAEDVIDASFLDEESAP